MPNLDLSKNVYFEKIRSLVHQIMLPQTNHANEYDKQYEPDYGYVHTLSVCV